MKNQNLRLTEPTTATQLNLQAPDDKGRRRFTMNAYTGAVVDAGIGRMVVDLAGVDVGGQRKPILRQHDPEKIAGYSEAVTVTPDGIRMEGALSSRTPAGKEIAELADDGFPWQASIGFSVKEYAILQQDETRQVNGSDFAGPGIVITKSKLRESSFVPLGADSSTSAAVFDDADSITAALQHKEPTMDNKPQAPAPDAAALADAENIGFKNGYAQAKAELKAMLDAFPSDQTFALAQFDKGNNPTQAKAEFADKVTAKLAETAAALEAAQQKLAAQQSDGQAALPLAKPAVEPPKEDELRKQFKSERAYQLYVEAQEQGRIKVISKQ